MEVAMGKQSKKKPCLLYIDDEEENLIGFKYMFRKDYEIFLANSGVEALDILKQNDIPLIISDQRMPNMTGVEFFKHVVQLYPHTMRMILTGYSDINAVIDSINQGQIYYYFKKPWDENEVRLVIKNALEAVELKQQFIDSEQRFRSTFEQAAVGIVHISPQGRFLQCNQLFLGLLGYSEEQKQSLTLSSIIHPDEVEKGASLFDDLLNRKRKFFSYECRVKHNDGTFIWVNLTVSTVPKANDETHYLIGVMEEITNLKQAEQKLLLNQIHLEEKVEERTLALKQEISERKKSEDTLRKLSQAVTQSPASVVITDLDGTIEYVNPKFIEVTGYSLEEVVGNNPRLLHSGEQSTSFYKKLWDTILAGETWHGELANKKKSGEIYWENATISPIRNTQGQATHFLGIKEDITQQRAARLALRNQVQELAEARRAMLNMLQDLDESKNAAEAAAQAKSDFLANMSHEIRTPMNAILGLTHLTLQTEITSRQQDYLTKIDVSAQNLLGIINDILDFSKIEAGKLKMEVTLFELEDVLQNVGNMISLKAQDKGIEFIISLPSNIPSFLMGDPLRLGQILINLGSNAVKFTHEGEIVIHIELVCEDDDDVELRFSVTDTGIGLSDEQMNLLFQAFSQADASTTREYGGTGLGLAISKQLVELMEGEISVESKPDSGSTFSFTAKFKHANEEQKRISKIPKNLRTIKALVVDDNETAQEILLDMMSSLVDLVDKADSGEQALEKLIEASECEHPFELVLMDWNMPGMDGIEATRRIKSHPKITLVPTIIMITAFGREKVMQLATDVDMAGVLLKPFTRSTLVDSLMEVFCKNVKRAGKHKTFFMPEALHKIRGARILVVEDNDINQQVAQEILQGAGFIVELASNGKDAVRMVKAAEKAQFVLQYDAVLMDIQMPVMGGIEATQTIRQWEKSRLTGEDKHLIPIIAMTAHAMEGDAEKSLVAGMNEHVTKPIDPNRLFSALVKWIKPIKGRDTKGKIYQSEEGVVQERVVVEDLAVGNELNEGIVTVAIADTGMEKEDAPALPELPGINVESALKRLGGNLSVYLKILSTFTSYKLRTEDDMTAALKAKDIDAARLLAHTLKGAAGGIGAYDLQKSAAKLESIMTQGNDQEIKDCLYVVRQKMNLVLTSIRELDSTKVPPALEAETKILSDGKAEILSKKEILHTVKPLLKELYDYLRSNDARANHCIETIIKLPGLDKVKEELEELKTYIDKYEFEIALDKTIRIAQLWKIEMDVTNEN